MVYLHRLLRVGLLVRNELKWLGQTSTLLGSYRHSFEYLLIIVEVARHNLEQSDYVRSIRGG